MIVCTGLADEDTVKDAIMRGVRHYLVKPVKPAILIEKVEEILARSIPVIEPRFDAMARLEVSEIEYKSFVLLCQDYLPSTPGSYRNALLEVDGFSADNSSRDLPQRDSVVQNDLRRLERDLDALKRL